MQTFGTSLGEVALVPATGGRFVVTLFSAQPESSHNDREQQSVEVKQTTIWDRSVDGGFPETKELKGRVRDVVEPGRGLGHTDRALNKSKGEWEGAGDGRGEQEQVVEDGGARDVEKDRVEKVVSETGAV